MININEEILRYLSSDIKSMIEGADKSILNSAEEIRIFAERHIIIYTANGFYFVTNSSSAGKEYKNVFVPPYKSVEKTVSVMCENSVYSKIDEIKNGFVTLPGGHRVGIVGNAVLDNEKISYIKNISCINIRIMREVTGAGDFVINSILSGEKIRNTLIISPPQCGKTTLIRDIARILAGKENSKKVGIVDERNEIVSMRGARVLSNIGLHSFVMTSCPKDIGINILTRTMSPDVLITDEIGSEKDAAAIRKALQSGVSVITTIHSFDEKSFFVSQYGKSIKDLFDLFIVLSRKNGPGTIEKIILRGDKM